MSRYQKLRDDIDAIEDQRAPYGALRVVVWVTSTIGWVVIAVHIALTVFVAHPFIRSKLLGAELPTLLLTLFFGLIGSLFGIGILASAQIIDLLMDIRNDVHLTRRYVRRFGLHMARGAEDKTE
ncbi:MAG: hypothetical protein HY865_00850 [Chloroflexi bacterium]|nr:hypothetical protein [Chloroflexota bacterium]